MKNNKSNLPNDANSEILTFARIFDTYLSESTAGFCLIDAAYNMVYANKTLERITGYKKDEIVGRNITEFSSLSSPEVQSVIKHYTGESLKDEPPLIFEFDLIRKEGKHKWVEVTIIPVNNKETNSLIGYIVNIIDKSEIKLIEEQGKFATYAFRSIHEGTVITNNDNVITQLNSAAEKIFNVKASEAIGKKLYDVVKIIEPSQAERDRELAEFEKSGEARWEHLIETAKGRVWIEVFVQKIKDSKDKTIATLAIITDISERKNYIEVLNFSDAAFKSIQEGTFLTDVDGRILAINEAAERIYGIKSEEVAGKPIFDFIKVIIPTPDELEQKLAENSEKGYTEYEQLAECPSGLKWTHNVLQQIKDENGKVIGGLGISTDITERKKMEEKLRFSDAAFKAIKEGIIITDTDFVITDWNEGSEKIFNVRASEAIGKKLFNILYLIEPSANEICKKHAVLDAKGFEGFVRTESKIRVNDNILWIEILAQLIKDSDGKTTGRLSIVTDITERKKIEEKLRFSDMAIKSIREGLAFTTMDNIISSWNEACEQICGIEASEAIGKNLWDIVEIQDARPEELEKEMHAFLAKGFMLSHKLVKVKEKVFWLEVSAHLIKDEKGNDVAVLSIISDVSENKKTEEALRFSDTALKSIQEGTIITDNSFNIISINETAENIFGVKSKNVIGKYQYDFIKIIEPSKTELEKEYGVYAAEGKIRYEHLIEVPSGRIWVDVLLQKIKDDDGNNIANLAIFNDITKRKQMEDLLRFSDAALKSIQEGTCLVNLKGEIIHINEATESIYGIKSSEVADKTIFDFIKVIVPTQDELNRKFDEYNEKGFTRFEQYADCPSGLIWTDTFLQQIKDDKGTVIGGLAIISDITQRKRIEQERADEATQRRILIDQSGDGIVVLDRDGKVYEANKRFTEMLGYTPAEVKELYVWDWEYLETRKQLVNKIKSIGEKGARFESKHRRKDGSIYDVEISVNGADFAGQKLLFCVCRDVTTRKKAEEALKESEDKYYSLFNRSTEGIFVHDLKGRIVDVNEVACSQSGYSREELLTLNIFDLHTDNTYSNNLSKIEITKLWNSWQTGERFQYEGEHQRKNGAVYPIEVSTGVIDYGNNKYILAIIKDITERKKAEDALRESEERFRHVAESADEWIWEVDAEGLYTYSSQTAEKIIGYSPEEIVGKKHFYDFYPPDVREELTNGTLEIAQQKQPFRSYGNPNIHKDGSLVIMDTIAAPIFDREGNITGYRGVDKDITERIKTEEKLRFSDAAFSSIQEGMIVSDNNLNVISINNAAEKIFGIKACDVIGKNLMHQFNSIEPSAEEIDKRAQKFLATGREWRFEHKIKAPSGEIWIDILMQKIKDENGNNVANLAIINDITLRKQTETALKESEERYRNITESTFEIIQSVDRDGKFLYVNNAWHKILGYSKEDLKSMTFIDILHPDSLEHCRKAFKDILSGKHVNNIEAKFRTKDGKTVIVEGNAMPRFTGDRVFGTLGFYSDITERKKMEEAIKEDADTRKKLFEQTPVGIVYIDPETAGILNFNNMACRQLGYSRKEFAKLTLIDIEAKLSKEQIISAIATLMEKGKSTFETVHKTRTGEIRNVQIISQVANVSGKAIFQSVWQDITERKKAEDALHLSDKAFKSIREAITITDFKEGRILFWNKANEELYHTKKEDALGKFVLDVIHVVEPSMEQLHRDHIALLIKGSARWEHLIQIDEKTRIWVELLSQLIQDENGETTAIMNIAMDITERKKMEEELRKKEASLAEAQKIAKVGSWYLDIENNDLVWSDEMFRLFGYKPGEVTPTRELFMQHIYDEDQHILRSAISAHESGEYQEESSNIIARFLRKNGEVWYGNSKARSIFDKSGRVIKEYGSIQDISDIKQAEEKDREIQNKLTTASRMASIGEVASGLAHEINNPLTGVIGFSQLLIDRDIPEDIKDDLEMINFEAQRAAKLVGGLMTFAQADEYGLTLSDINRIIVDTIELRSYEMKMNGIEIVTELDTNLPRISVDEVQLQQAFLNIILNAEQAIKNTKKKGLFTVKTEHSDNFIKVSFTDDGPGISSENLKKIFSPFHKFDNNQEGIGLGLSMSHDIITRHGGKISVHSEPGQGTQFTVELPLNDVVKTAERQK